MIMMRSTPVAKMGKPPPPVPPRPSKALVAEALAKTKREISKNIPIRTAPLPPNRQIDNTAKPNINISKKPIPPERSIVNDEKNSISSRTVIFQSHINNKQEVKIENKDSNKKKIELTKVNNSFVNDNNKIARVESFKNNKSEKIEELDLAHDDLKNTELAENNSKCNTLDKKWNQILNDRNHVNTLIDEMFASVLEVSSSGDDKNEIESTKIQISNVDNNEESSPTNTKTVVVIDDNKDSISRENSSDSSSIGEGKKVQFDDRMNHELLISELESMRIEEEIILKRQRQPSKDIFEEGDSGEVPNIQHSDWVEVSDGQEVRLSSCQITIEELKNKENKENKNVPILDYERIKTMSSLHGLPPLPKSLSGFSLLEGQTGKPPTPVRTTSMRSQTGAGHLVYPPHKVNGSTDATSRKSTNLDTQLAILRREMYSLRQLDLSLLSQLWSLNESIQDFRQILQDQEDRILSPPSPSLSPTPSSGDDVDGDDFYVSASSMTYRTPPPPPPVRRPSSSSNASSLG